jgi:hypothetical protein
MASQGPLQAGPRSSSSGRPANRSVRPSLPSTCPTTIRLPLVNRKSNGSYGFRTNTSRRSETRAGSVPRIRSPATTVWPRRGDGARRQIVWLGRATTMAAVRPRTVLPEGSKSGMFTLNRTGLLSNLWANPAWKPDKTRADVAECPSTGWPWRRPARRVKRGPAAVSGAR